MSYLNFIMPNAQVVKQKQKSFLHVLNILFKSCSHNCVLDYKLQFPFHVATCMGMFTVEGNI